MHLQTHWSVQELTSKTMTYIDRHPEMKGFYNVMDSASIHTADGLKMRVAEALNEIKSSTFINICQTCLQSVDKCL